MILNIAILLGMGGRLGHWTGHYMAGGSEQSGWCLRQTGHAGNNMCEMLREQRGEHCREKVKFRGFLKRAGCLPSTFAGTNCMGEQPANPLDMAGWEVWFDGTA